MFDRIWKDLTKLIFGNHFPIRPVSGEEPISTNNTKELPPHVVMQTMKVINDMQHFKFTVGTTNGHKLLLILYFAKIEKLNMP